MVDAWPELAGHGGTRFHPAGVEFVTDHSPGPAARSPRTTCRCDRSDLVANGLRPDLYCKPIINSAEDRAPWWRRPRRAPQFFLGTDSAPHPSAHKYTDRAKPGIFNAPFALPVVAEVFHQAGALAHLEAFVSLNGCGHYGYPPSGEKLRLTRVADGCASTGDPVPDSVVTADGQQVVIFGVDEARRWRVEWL